MGHSHHSGVDARSHFSNATQDGAQQPQQSVQGRMPTPNTPASPEQAEIAVREARQEVERRGADIQKLESEVAWYKNWADTYWQQLQHMSAAAAALSQQHVAALNQQQQHIAALAQYHQHVQAAAQVGKAATAAMPAMRTPALTTPPFCFAQGGEESHVAAGGGAQGEPLAADASSA